MINLNQNSVENINHLFNGNKQYQQSRDHFRKQIKANNQIVIFNAVPVLVSILKSHQSTPISKLLAIRFIRQCINCISYGFITLVNSQLCPLLLKIALYDKQNKQEERGRSMFFNAQIRSQDKRQLQIIGFSIHKLVLQSFMILSKWMPFLPYHQLNSVTSVFARKKSFLDQMQVTFPQNLTYYKLKDTERFIKDYSQRKTHKEDIQLFYQYLTQKFKEDKQFAKSILKNIMQTGDNFCIQPIISIIQNLLQENKIEEGLNLAHQLYLLGNIQYIIKLEDHVLLHFATKCQKLVLEQKTSLATQIQQKLYFWGTLSKDKRYTYQKIYSILNQKYKDYKNFQQTKQFQENSLVMDQINRQLIKTINLQVIQNQRLLNILTKFSKHQKFDVKGSKIKSDKIQQLAFNKSEQLKLTPVSSSSFIEGIKLSKLSLIQKKKLTQDIDALKSIRKKSTDRHSLSKDHYSTPYISKKISDYDRGQILSQKSISELNYQSKIIQLEKKLNLSKKKQQHFDYMLKQKEARISQLQKKPKQQKLLSARCLQNQKMRNFDHPYYDNSNIPKKYKFPSKTKKQILKNKTLLLKNSHIEVGLITLFQHQKLGAHIYVTPLIDYQSIETNIRCPQWITSTINPNNQKFQITSNIQFIIFAEFILAPAQNRKHFNSLPEMTLILGNDNKFESIHIFLPIFITKFCTPLEITIKQCENILIQKIIQKKPSNKLESKIVKNYQSFDKYFAKTIVFKDFLIFKFKFQNSSAILAIKITSENMQIAIIPTTKWLQPDLNLITDAYTSLLSL